MNEKHIFAIYSDDVSFDTVGQSDAITITNEYAYHRIVRVLRMGVSDPCILFNRTFHAVSVIKNIRAKSIECIIQSVQSNPVMPCAIHFVLPILKREDLENAVSVLTEIGVTSIQLISTHKVQRSFDASKELPRMHKIMVAAAEQSKNFSFPIIYPPVDLATCLQKSDPDYRILFHPSGAPLTTFLKEVPSVASSFTLICGPEGDFTPAERQYCSAHNVKAVCLTPTVLRAVTAVTIGAGVIRSLF